MTQNGVEKLEFMHVRGKIYRTAGVTEVWDKWSPKTRTLEGTTFSRKGGQIVIGARGMFVFWSSTDI